MRTIAIFFFVLSFAAAAMAQHAGIDLPPMHGDKELDEVDTQNFTGSCGSAIVRVMGVVNTITNFYTLDLDAGRIIIRSRPKGKLEELVLSPDNGILSDHNGIACVPTKSGPKLLVWSACGGSGCGGGFEYFVIDPETQAFIAPQDRKGLCDAACASKAIGSKLPMKLDKERNGE